MKPPQRVVWSEGMLVSPQHMQQQDLYHERLLDERVAALAPYRWGVVTVEIDPGALGTNQLRITRFVGVLPDGQYVGFESGDAECPPARPVEEHFGPTRPSCEIFLGLPKEREGVPSIDTEQATTSARVTKSARARYRSTSRTIADLTGTAADLSMAFAHRNTVNETYIPPTMRIDGAPFLMGGVRRLLALMVNKQRQLAGDRRQRDGAHIEFNAGDITRFLQLNTVNSAIPMLTYATSNGEISPNQLYLLLVQVAGQLATFSADVDPSTLPIYAYTDLRGTFEELFARVTALLQTTVREAYIVVPMEVIDGIHLGKLDDDRMLTAPQYVLAVRSELPEAQLAQRLPGLCKIASRAQLPQVIRSASTPGVPIQVTHRPPAEIAIRAGVTYFTLTLQNEYWREIVQDRLVSIYLPPPFDPERVKLELLAIPRGSS
jgi:type VI secretion system protein ImpJ